MEEKKCTQCKKSLSVSQFEGVKKSCTSCLAYAKAYRAKPENKKRMKETMKKWYKDPENKKRQGERAKKRFENPENKQRKKEFDAKYHKDPVNKKRAKERHAERYEENKNNPKYRIRLAKNSAKQRKYIFELTDERCEALMKLPCYLCASYTPGILVGMDRMDNMVGYTLENTAGCCDACNIGKLCLDPRTDIKRSVHRNSIACGSRDTLHPKAWPDQKGVLYSAVKYSAKKRELSFELTKEEYARLTELPCVWCDREITATNKSGIDRIDNDKGYILGNVQPCCGECNQQRGSKTVMEFLFMNWRKSMNSHNVIIPPHILPCLRAVTKRSSVA